jgi:hypothetical protein
MRAFRPVQCSLSGAALLVCVAASPPAAPATAPATAPAATVAALSDSQPHGRSRDPGAPPKPSTPDEEAARRAAELHHQAMEAGEAGKWRRSASLHRRAAAQHTAGDGRGSRCLEYAGAMLYAAKDLRGTQRVLAEAAKQAAARGEIAAAANTYLDAGLVASELRDEAGAAELARRASLLARSPQLSAAERTAILGRIVER